MIDRLLEAGAKGILAGIIGSVVYGIYYLILRISKRKKDKIKER